MWSRILALALLVAPLAALAQADTPIYVVQHGRLVGNDDKPLTAPVQVTVTLYASKDENDGTWTDTFDLSPSTNGTYEIVLGTKKQLLAADFNGRKYLGVSIGGTPLEPRLRIGTTPWAANATNAERLGGKAASDYALKADVPATAADAEKLGGKAASEYALKADVPTKAADSDKLGGKAADLYALKTDVPTKAADSDKLGGVSAASLLDSNGRLLPGALPAGVSFLDGGKLPATALPSGAVTLGSDGKIPTSELGNLPLSLLPTGVAGTSAGLALLDSSGKIPAAALPATSNSLSRTENNLANGQCITLQHNWNTRAVFYQAWMNDGGTWLPMSLAGRDAQTNIALGKSCANSSQYPDPAHVCGKAYDGNLTTGWHTASGDGQGFVTVNLGGPTLIDRVKIVGHPYNTGWEVLVSNDGTSFGTAVTTGACSVGGSCGTLVESTFNPVTATYVRVRDTGGDPSWTYFAEIEIYGASYPITQPDLNSVRLCNYTGKARDMALIVSK